MTQRNPADYEPTVSAFVDIMLEKLHANDHKSHWCDQTLDHLRACLFDELRELAQELSRVTQDVPAIGRECADVANMAMMIADRVGAVKPNPGRLVTIELLQNEVIRLQGLARYERDRWQKVWAQHREERERRQRLVATVSTAADVLLCAEPPNVRLIVNELLAAAGLPPR